MVKKFDQKIKKKHCSMNFRDQNRLDKKQGNELKMEPTILDVKMLT